MSNKTTTNQVFRSGFSFLTVTFTFIFNAYLFYRMALATNNLLMAGLFLIIGAFILLIGMVGLMSKFMTDGITMGLENGKLHPSMRHLNPMTFGQTIRAGLDLIAMVCLIVLITSAPIVIGITQGSLQAMVFWFAIALIVSISGLLGIFVKVVGDSISHAISVSGYGALLHQVGVRELSEHKEEIYQDSVSVSSELEWTDSEGHKWKKIYGVLYWWNGNGWQRHG